MSGVVLRCPNCGTTRGTAGLCEACHEAEVRCFCSNHSLGLWLDGPACAQCGARLGDPDRPPVAAPRPRPAPVQPPAASRQPPVPGRARASGLPGGQATVHHRTGGMRGQGRQTRHPIYERHQRRTRNAAGPASAPPGDLWRATARPPPAHPGPGRLPGALRRDDGVFLPGTGERGVSVRRLGDAAVSTFLERQRPDLRNERPVFIYFAVIPAKAGIQSGA